MPTLIRETERHCDDPTSTSTDAEFYGNEMLELNNGYGLYEPGSGNSYDRVRPGDVGWTLDGSFRRVFNICTNDPAINNLGVPENFAPIDEASRATYSRSALPPGEYATQYVRKVDVHVGVEG